MKRYTFLFLLITQLLDAATAFSQTNKQPNFIIILADGLGYGNLSSYRNPTIRTPNLDKMALEGTRFYTVLCGCQCLFPDSCGATYRPLTHQKRRFWDE